MQVTNVLMLYCLQIMESYVNPRIELDPQLWSLPETFGPRSPTDQHTWVESLKNRNLARITTLIRDPETHLPEIETTYQRICGDCATMAAILATIPVVPAADGRLSTPLPLRARRLHVRWQTGYGILLSIAILLNRLLSIYRGPDSPDVSSLRDDRPGFVDGVILLAEQASQYRPLGSSATSLFLLAAYAVLEEGQDDKRDRIEALLMEYQSDFGLRCGFDLANGLRDWFPHLHSSSSQETSEEHCEAGNQSGNITMVGQYSIKKSDLCCIL